MLALCKRNHEQINLQYINYIYILSTDTSHRSPNVTKTRIIDSVTFFNKLCFFYTILVSSRLMAQSLERRQRSFVTGSSPDLSDSLYR